MSQDPEDLMQITITDENGVSRDAWVCRIVAERDLINVGPGGEEVTVANKGDKGGYVECDVEFDEDGNPHPILPVQPGEDGAPSDRYDGKIKGLSQNDTSWVHAGTIAAGEVSIRDNAQFLGPDAMSTGADEYTGDVGVGGSYFRSEGRSTFEGRGTYVDMEMQQGARYEFSGGTNIGGPVVFEEGRGKFQDGPNGEETYLFAADAGTSLTVATKEGFESNGMTALDNTDLRGSFKGNPEMIVQNSAIDVEDVNFTGGVTMVNQELGPDANGQEITSDADLDAVALTTQTMFDDEPGLTGVERRDRMESWKAYEDGDAYREHVANVLAHELGENFGDSSVQMHQDDVHDKMHGQLLEDWDASPEDTDPDKFYEEHRVSSEYQAGINDAPTEDQREIMSATGMTPEELGELQTKADGGVIAARGGWDRWSQIREGHQPDAHKNQTNPYTQYDLTGDGGGLNPGASAGLYDGGTPVEPRKDKTPNLGSLEAIANRVKENEERGKDNDGPEK